jgi:rod shape-determining protein MreC
LQVLSVYLIISYSKYHQSVFGSALNNITGKINEKYSNVQRYFYLQKTNDSLLKANEILYNKLKDDFAVSDTNTRFIIDTLKIDSISSYRKYKYIGARVISNSISNQSNYIVLSIGTKQQVKVGMGVIDPNNNVVGIITDANENYSTVMSLLHKDSHISGKLLRSGEAGTLYWDGKEPNKINLTGIPKSAKVVKGDTIISSGFSTAFPKGMYIGKVEEIFKETASNYFRLKFKSTANFYNLQYVFVIENTDQDAVKELLEKTQQKQ